MKGFTKGKGSSKKFIPTKSKKGLSKSDIKINTRHEDSIPFGAITQFATDKAINKGIDLGNKLNNPLLRESITEASKEKAKSGLISLGKGIISKSKELKEQKKKANEDKRQFERDQEIITDINTQAIDSIIDDRTSTNEQKFRFLQRYAVENNDSLTENQRMFVNNTLKALDSEGNAPSTFIGSSQGSRSSSSNNKSRQTSTSTKSTVDNSASNFPSNAVPMTLNSGKVGVPTEFENNLNNAKSLNPTIVPTVPQPTTTTTTTTSGFPSNLSDNTNAEIGALIG